MDDIEGVTPNAKLEVELTAGAKPKENVGAADDEAVPKEREAVLEATAPNDNGPVVVEPNERLGAGDPNENG